jgi:hypothetical protein
VRADGLRGVFLRSGRGQAPTDYPLNKRVKDPKDQYRTKRKKNRKEKKVEQNNKEDLKLSHHTVFHRVHHVLPCSEHYQGKFTQEFPFALLNLRINILGHPIIPCCPGH